MSIRHITGIAIVLAVALLDVQSAGAKIKASKPSTGWVAWWGLRAINPGAPIKAINVRRSDGATADISTLSNGGLDIDTARTFCTATCTITRFYDQTGNGYDQVQTRVPAQATLQLSPLTAIFNGTSTQYQSAITFSVPQPFTVMAMFSYAASAPSGDPWSLASGQYMQMFNNQGSGGWSDLFSHDASDHTAGWFFFGSQGYDLGRGSVIYSSLLSYNGGESFWDVNGAIFDVNKLSSTQNGGNPSGPTFDSRSASGTFTLGARNNKDFMAMHFYEGGISSGDMTKAEAAATTYNQQAFWSKPTITIAGVNEKYGGGLWSILNNSQSTGYTTLEMTVPTATFPASPNGTRMIWNLMGASGAGVFSFQNLAWATFGNCQNSTLSWNTIAPSQIKNITTLIVSHDISYTITVGDSINHDIIYDGFVCTGPSSAVGSGVFEFSVAVHTGGPCRAMSGAAIGPFTDQFGKQWYVFKRDATPPQITFFPGPLNSCPDFLVGSVDLLGMFNYLILKGLATGNEYFTGFGIGVEPFIAANGGNLTFKSVSVDYSAKP